MSETSLIQLRAIYWRHFRLEDRLKVKGWKTNISHRQQP